MPTFDFNEDYAAEFDSLDSRAVNFDYEEIYKRFDGAEPIGTGNAIDLNNALKGIGAFMHWCASPVFERGSRTSKKAAMNKAALRLCAAMWVMHPERFDEDDGSGAPSAAELSRRLGYKYNAVSEEASEFTRTFGIRNRAQCHGRNGENAAKLRGQKDVTIPFFGTKCHVEH